MDAPGLNRMLYADGKVITPLFKGKPGEVRVDKVTGEIKPLRHEVDADLHFEGTGEVAYGTKFVMVAARSTQVRSRMILDVEWVPNKGAEAKVAMECFGRLAPSVPGAQGVSTTPDFECIYSRRNDSESINRGLDDTLWLSRAHSVGHGRQLLNLLGYALMVNGLTLHEHRRRREPLPAAA